MAHPPSGLLFAGTGHPPPPKSLVTHGISSAAPALWMHVDMPPSFDTFEDSPSLASSSTSP
ncbi:DNA-binding transcriptional activator of the SARP family [Sesbania bispinosa]|nr:DNA-binding transcriptional activator of the SARP family [Sesbania bispinosa]